MYIGQLGTLTLSYIPSHSDLLSTVLPGHSESCPAAPCPWDCVSFRDGLRLSGPFPYGTPRTKAQMGCCAHTRFYKQRHLVNVFNCGLHCTYA